MLKIVENKVLRSWCSVAFFGDRIGVCPEARIRGLDRLGWN